MWSKWLRVLALGGAFACVSCVSATAPIERTVKRGGLTAHVEKAGTRPGGEVRFALVLQRVPPGTKLLGASFSAERLSLCGGLHASTFGRSGSTDAQSPLRSGERLVIDFHSADPGAFFEPGAHLDLLLGGTDGRQRCYQLPLADAAQPLAWDVDQKFTIGVDVGAEGFTRSLNGVTHLIGFPLTLGVWLDTWHVSAGAAVAGAGCTKQYCPPARDGQNNETTNFSTIAAYQVGVTKPIHEWGELSFGVGARYRAMKLSADTYAGNVDVLAHGAVLAPYLGVVPPMNRGKLSGARTVLLGVDLPVGYMMTEDGELAATIGLSLRFLCTAF
jgi:hypothetical protein